jgi:predicted peroxiredoxin
MAEHRREDEGMDRADFLKALGATGLGLGLGAFTASHAGAEEKGVSRYVFVISRGGEDPNRAVWALLMAQTVADKDWGKVHVWFTLQGADLAHATRGEKIESPIFKKWGNAAAIMKKLKEKGATFGVCPPCAEYYGANDQDRLSYVESAGGDWLMKNIQGASVLWI